MVGSGGNAPLVIFLDLFFDGRFTVGCEERRPTKNSKPEIRNPKQIPMTKFEFSLGFPTSAQTLA
jgi:hypothetical protein